MQHRRNNQFEATIVDKFIYLQMFLENNKMRHYIRTLNPYKVKH